MAKATDGGGPPGDLKIVVIDDDPTGSQTVHGCPLVLRWDHATLVAGLRHPSPLLFLLADTRSLDPGAVPARVEEICRALRPALAEVGVERWLIVSRGDSTLRSHFPLEVDAIARVLGPFDATLLVPAFLEGGRTTVDGIHRLHGTPVHRTPFARDRLFGYGTSFLPAWVEEKTAGRVPAAAVQRIGAVELGDPEALRRRLAALGDNAVVAVDAERPEHLGALGEAVRRLTDPAAAAAEGRARRFLFQSAASLLNGLADLPPQARGAAELAALRRRAPDGRPRPGLVLVGSHVPLADEQLEALLADPACAGVELPVDALLRALEGGRPAAAAAFEASGRDRLEQALALGRTPVLFTSRGERACRDPGQRRALGQALADAMARLVAALAPRLGYVISKGGITSQTLLRDGLALAAVELQGQLLPGLSLVLAPIPPTAAAAAGPGDGPRDGPRDGVAGGELPVLTFPGNLGDRDTLRQAWRWMEDAGAPAPPV